MDLGVVWFGEALPADAIEAAQEAAASCDFFISIGTSGAVYPAAGLIEQAIQAKARVLEINLEPTPFSEQADWSIREKSGEVLPELVKMLV